MTKSALLQACRLLFGEEVVISDDFLAYLQPGGLKSAYRRRALETHPDSQPLSASDGVETFFAMQQAYQLLAAYLRKRDHRFAEQVNTIAKTAAQEQPPSLRTIDPIIIKPYRWSHVPLASIDHLYQGPLPERSLLFGHFLYYCGLTTWRTITSVLVQQQRGRPRCGELGLRYGMLRPQDIVRILAAKRATVPFGETAVALGLLSEQQLHTLLRHQQLQQKKFGAILLENNLITPQELTFLLNLFRRHNRFRTSR